MAEGKKLNVYTDSRYAFATAHIHGEIYRWRGLLTSEGKDIKNKTEILALLKALFLPQKLSIIHCPGHQKGDSPEARGNRMADRAAPEAATHMPPDASQAFPLSPEITDVSSMYCPFHYTKEDTDLLEKMGASYEPTKGHWAYKEKPVMPMKQTFELITYLHKLTHLSPRKMKTLLDREEGIYYLLGRDSILQQVVDTCRACAQVDAGKTRFRTGIRMRDPDRVPIGKSISQKSNQDYKYLLVFVDTFSGWVEAFPTKHETAKIVTKKLLEEIFPRYGMPQALGSDNGPAFVSQVSQLVAKLLGID